jgi:segregation and condensation protein B
LKNLDDLPTLAEIRDLDSMNAELALEGIDTVIVAEQGETHVSETDHTENFEVAEITELNEFTEISELDETAEMAAADTTEALVAPAISISEHADGGDNS